MSLYPINKKCDMADSYALRLNCHELLRAFSQNITVYYNNIVQFNKLCDEGAGYNSSRVYDYSEQVFTCMHVLIE